MPTPSRRSRPARGGRQGVWTLQDAKARLSDIVRRAQTEGPQHVTVHGKQTAVILSEETFVRLQGGRTGRALIEALRACPDPDLDLEPVPIRSPVRDVAL